MGGYVVTGLRDTPIATSGLFDDFDRPKWPAEVVRQFNDDAILSLDTGRRRRWTNGGDRPDRLDVYNHWGGPHSTASWHIILSAYGSALESFGLSATSSLSAASGRLSWRLSDPEGAILDGGQLSVDRPIRPGAPVELAVLSCALPEFLHASQLRLEVALSLPGLEVSNAWPIWVYPPVSWPSGLGLYDPSHILDGLEDLIQVSRRLESAGDWDVPLVVATTWGEDLNRYLRQGGRAILLQQGDGPLPARRGPFWREGLKLFAPHPLWEIFPHPGYADLQFFGLASDIILDASRLAEVLPGVTDIRPVLRRLDERQFTLGDYLLEARVDGGGLPPEIHGGLPPETHGGLLACSLRVQGGAGAQPAGLQRNVAGAYLLWAMISYLMSTQA
jgi:hypothetical protein